ncbi:TMEM175 family protein [Aquisphaera insulae]|uniref:TMEM175 family protein n=1 Tax=Aquisphaera insulae TaxID=2712864 RepID=UPI0013E9A5F6|nr:TMEM175 family protein [Aquisphaera insulae]
MKKSRLEAFSDGVVAILITIMVFDIKAPAGDGAEALWSVMPRILTYVLSYVYLGIYWNNHHHMLQMVDRVDGASLWANLHLLFWLSFFPFATSWLASSGFARLPAASYGVILLMAAIAYTILQSALIRCEGRDSCLREAVGDDLKGKLSIVGYLAGILAAFVSPWISLAFYVAVALLWLIPDRRIESRIDSHARSAGTHLSNEE